MVFASANIKPNDPRPRRRSLRLPGYDYSQSRTRGVNERAGKQGVLWQRGYYEHVIPNEKALDRIRAYITNNPARWADDPENVSRAACPEEGRV